MHSSASTPPTPEDFGILLGLAYQRFVEELNQHLHKCGFADLGSSFGYVLRAVASDPVTATELAARLRLTPQGAAKIVDDMVKGGYVERRPDPHDARARRLVLARRGRRALAEARAFHADFERRLEDTLGKRGAAELRRALESLVAGTEGGADTSSRVLRPL